MVKLYQNLTRWENNIVVVLHIYGAAAIFLLFSDDQDAESQ